MWARDRTWDICPTRSGAIVSASLTVAVAVPRRRRRRHCDHGKISLAQYAGGLPAISRWSPPSHHRYPLAQARSNRRCGSEYRDKSRLVQTGPTPRYRSPSRLVIYLSRWSEKQGPLQSEVRCPVYKPVNLVEAISESDTSTATHDVVMHVLGAARVLAATGRRLLPFWDYRPFLVAHLRHL